jgi:glycosyltransferase involved in cell wall biosynthesis
MREKPKVAFFYFFLAAGGVERSFIQIANHWSEKVLVEFMVMERSGAFLPKLSPRVKLHSFDLIPHRLIHHFWLIIKMAKHFREAGYTHVITGMPASNLTVIIAKILSFKKMKVIISEHGSTGEWLKVRKKNMAVKALVGVLVLAFYRVADGIIAVSHGIKDELARFALLDMRRIKVIYNPFTPAKVSSSAGGTIHPWFKAGKKTPVIVAIGRLERVKDFPTLLSAFAELRRSLPARLIILGEGAERARLEARIEALGLQDAVALPGFKPNAQDFLARADLFVQSSLTEGLPTVLLEALSQGTQVVTTDNGSGTREILRDGKLGSIVPVGDAGALSRAMKASLTHAFHVPKATLKKGIKAFSAAKAFDAYERLCFGHAL